MATGIPTHDFEAAISQKSTYKRIGEVKILWGLISYPKIITTTKYRRLKFCRYCGEVKNTTIHGYYNLSQSD